MIIDCHGHYTTAPGPLQDFREKQVSALEDPALLASLTRPNISDDQIRDSLEGAQLKLQRERGSDLTIFSPRASAMAHHIGDERTSLEWSQICNDLIARVVDLYPENFIGVCQPPEGSGFRLAPMKPMPTQRSSSAALWAGAAPGDCGSWQTPMKFSG